MAGRKPKAAAIKTPIAVGTGLIALDVVFADGILTPVGRWAGGTCGNVLTILSFLGWDSYPVSRLKKNEESDQIVADLKKWKVHDEFISYEDTGSTPVIIEYLRRNPEGAATHRFSLRCPVCGTRLPSFRPVTLNAVQDVINRVSDPSVFFFDRVSPAALSLAKAFAMRGSIIVFEPTSIGDERQFEKAVRVSHIVKYSHERLSRLSSDLQKQPLLIIETLGEQGLRYRSNLESCKSTKWQSSEAFAVPRIADSAGAGDWFSAGLISKLATGRLAGFIKSKTSDIAGAIRYGQALAAWCCGFESPRGGMYRHALEEVRRQVDRLVGEQSAILSSAVAAKASRSASITTSSHLCNSCRSG